MNIWDKIKDKLKNIFTLKQSKSESWFKPYGFQIGTSYMENPNLFSTNVNIFNKNNVVHIRKLSDYFTICKEDEEINACIDQLTYKVCSLEDSKELEHCYAGKNRKLLERRVNVFANRIYKSLGITGLKSKAVECSLKTGLAVFQIKWKNNGKVDPETGYIEIEEVIQRNPDYFVYKYNSDGIPELWYRNPNSNKEHELNPYEFVAFRNGNSDINPYGYSEINKVGVDWYYRRQAINAYRFRTMERKGDPALKLNLGEGSEVLDRRDIEQTIDNLYENNGVGGVVYFPRGLDAGYLETNMKQAFDYKQVWDDSKNAIRVHILNATSTMSNTDSVGSYNQSSVHENSENAKVDTKAKNLEDFVNGIIRLAIDINFRDVNLIKYPKYNIVSEKEQSDRQKRERELSENKQYICDLIDRTSDVPKKSVFEMFGLPTDHIEHGETFNNNNNNLKELKEAL